MQAFVKMLMTRGRNQPRALQNRRFFRDLNNVTLVELPSKLMQRTHVLTCSLQVDSLHTLFAITVGLHCSLSWHY